MAAQALKDIRERDQLRRLFNRSATAVESHIKERNFSKATIEITYLEEKIQQLNKLDNQIRERMLSLEDFNEASYTEEVDKAEEFVHKWYTIKEICSSFKNTTTDVTSQEVKSAKNYKLPKIEFKKFDDDLKNWLGFWGQFKKIHMDTNMNNEDKFQYLIQSMKEGSNARALVESFPPSADNYSKAIDQLKARFGCEDLLIQVYVRQLLTLVLNHNKNQQSIRNLYDKLSTYLLSLETLGIVKQKYETILYPLVESAIPETILIAWNRINVDNKSSNQLTKLLNFLKCEVDTEERVKLARSEFDACVGSKSSFNSESSLPTAAALVSNTKPGKEFSNPNSNCYFCDKSGHNTFECSKASKMSLDDKKEAIKKKGCCYICLRKGHMANKCKNFVKCIACGRRHFVILCPDVHNKSSDNRTSENVLICARNNTTTLLQTLIVNVAYNGKYEKVRALLDSGSQRSYVKAAVVKKLGLRQTGTEKIGHMLFGGVEQPAEVYKCFELKVSSLDNSFHAEINALQQADLCGHLPKVKNVALSKKLRDLNIKISDFQFADTEIGLLIGSDHLGSIVTNELVHLDDNLMAVKTNLGWTLQGPINNLNSVNTNSVSCFSKTNLSDLWSVELLGIQDPYEKQCKNVTETEVLKNFNNNISVNAEGRYNVSLLWKDGCPRLSTNYEVASKRLESTTKKLKLTGNLNTYNHVLQTWEKDDIIEKVTDDNMENGHYLPHHGVIKPHSTSTRVRPVYDASTKDRNGWSLNSCLDKGVNMIELLPKLLIQFRKGAYGVVSDIKQAFLQICVTEQDRDYLKFLWWENIETCDKIVTYRHKRVVFGITCSPFLLSATLNYHLDLCTEGYKKTATKLKESFYVDNCVTSFDSIEELKTFITESATIMKSGMFDLRGWVTAPRRIDDTVSISVLGMTWNTLQDDIRCNVSINVSSSEHITKRYVISVAQHVFDPLGLVCPTTLIPKLIMQKIWELNLDWDEEIPSNLAQEFKNWLKTAHLINQCRIPRRVSVAPIEECVTSLHIFGDACQTSYAGCVFLRTRKDKNVHVQLILAKSRVAPASKKMSLPRLELMGALIASRLYKEVMESGILAQCKKYKTYFWTDSAVVYAWIKRQTQWKLFVSNRVKEICTTSNRNDWHHLPGEHNPADLPSRGCNAQRLLESRWWEGPTWLKDNIEDWPKSSVGNLSDACEELVRAEISKNAVICTDVTTVPFSRKLMYFSKYNRMVRLVAWILRMSCKVRKKFNAHGSDITNDEYINAENSLIRLLQKEEFTQKCLPKNLNTFMDDEGVIRVKTRLELSHEDKKFVNPVLLPGRNEIIQRLVRQRHEKLNHAGTQLLMSNLRNCFWILNIRRLAKKIVARCVVCKRDKCKHYEVPEAPLPAGRVEASAVFQVTGIDLAGPLYLRNQEKCWIVLFTCATYRAVHLELVDSLSTNSFLMALRRFIARRGRINVIYTDCGSNFQGSANLLKEINWCEIEAATAIVPPPIKWRFLPPRAPWWGGWWERLVRVVKDMLRRILGKQTVTWIELSTLLCECEAVINSRPLTYVATDDYSLKPLTPMMFLHPLHSTDTPDLDQIDSNNINIRYQYLDKLRADYRQRFRNEYLALLCSRNRCIPNFPKVNDIVLIETDSKRLYWPLGIVKELLTGADGHSRAVRVQTANGEWIRACQKLYPLELSAVSDEWRRTGSNTGKPETCLHNEDLNSGEASNSDLDNLTQPPSVVTRHGREIKVPKRFLE